jgi:hypothetical protein
MCLYTQEYMVDQTSTSEKHVYIKCFFAIVDRVRRYDATFMHSACMRFLRPRDLALLNMTLHLVGASAEFGPFFYIYNPKIVIPGTFM